MNETEERDPIFPSPHFPSLLAYSFWYEVGKSSDYAMREKKKAIRYLLFASLSPYHHDHRHQCIRNKSVILLTYRLNGIRAER